MERRAAIGSRNGPHQRVVLHRLVEIDGAACRHIEAGDPHRTHEYKPERVVGVLEFTFKVLLLHPFPVGQNVEALCFRSSISFCDRLTITAMSTERIQSRRSKMPERASSGALTNCCSRKVSSVAHALRTFSCIRTAVALSIATNMPFRQS
jgi:hypothetical protein